MLRSFHAMGVALFFIFLYAHLGRSLFFGYGITSFSTYYTGAILFVGFFAIAFLGYALIMGSMSLWAVIVIISFFNMFPSVVPLALGGFVPASYVLGRFFVLHFLLPHVMIVVFAIHILLLHNSSSSSGTSAAFSAGSTTLTSFAPLNFFKHSFTLVLFFAAYILVMCFYPFTFAHPLAAVPPSLLVTPSHIVPEFYFLPFYGVLKAIPSFNAGLMFFVSLLLSCIHLRHSIVHSVLSTGTHTSHRTVMYPLCLMFTLAFFLLAFLGSAITTATILGYSRVLILLITTQTQSYLNYRMT
jgi:ubiquinol-cytochrome c reductase cytochrome b subunit